MTGPPDPAQPTRAERDAYAMAQLRRAAALRKAGTARPGAGGPAADAGPAQRPAASPVGGGARPGAAAGRAGADRARGDPVGAGLVTTNTGHLLQLTEAFWHLDVEPQIDEMVRQRIPPAEYERYRQDPERPAFLKLLREHEIGGRRIEDVLDSITAEPLTGLRSIAAGLHGRAGKEPAPREGRDDRMG